MQVSAYEGSQPRTRLVSMTTSATSCLLLQRGQLEYLRDRGFDVTAIAAPSEELRQFGEREGVDVVGIPMTREICPLRDLLSLCRVWRTFRRLRPAIVNAGTPKAGFLGMLAARLAGVPVRIYTQRGLRLQTCKGLKLWMLFVAEWLAFRCATRVVCVSQSLRECCIDRGLVDADKVIVIGDGSSNGVDGKRLSGQISLSDLDKLRKNLNIPAGVPVVGFVGRLTRDKGINELWGCFTELLQYHRNAHLLIVGGFEAGDPVDPRIAAFLHSAPNVVITGFVSDTSAYYHLMTVLAFPSFREGFPNVPLEAACAGVPTVGFAATGTVDAIQDGVTGAIVPLGDVRGLSVAIVKYIDHARLRQRHGRAAQHRALVKFAPERIHAGLVELYTQQLCSSGVRVIGESSLSRIRKGPAALSTRTEAA